MKFSIVQKLSLSTIILVLISAGLVGGLFYSKTSELLVQNKLENISTEIHTAGNRLIARIEVLREDALFLTSMPPIQGLLRALKDGGYDKKDHSSHQEWAQRLEKIFKTMLNSKPAYLKIRFIDKDGQEHVVVGRNGNSIEVVRSSQLQNKRHRRYVKETLNLAVGSVYLSEINLNREHGKVSLPHQEVLRSASPVYDKETGKVAGLVLITAEIAHELREIQSIMQKDSARIYITNDHGGYLLHPDNSKGYGFDLGKRYRIQEEIPQLSEMFLPDNQQTDFVLLPKDTDGQHVLNFIKVSFDPARPERFIAVGMTELYSSIMAQQSGVLNKVLLLALALVVVITLMAIFFSYRLAAPIKQLTQVMDDYAHQRQSIAEMPKDRGDEIGVLVQSYQSLMTQVEEAQVHLEDMNRNLESKVLLRTQELDRFKKTLDETLDCVFMFEPVSLKFFYVNAGAVNQVGYSHEELMNMTAYSIKPEYTKEKFHEMIAPMIAGNQSVASFETIHEHKDGHEIPVEIFLQYINPPGEHPRFVAIVRDISERLRTDKMKNEFISTVSHELRTPLTSIRASLGLVSQGVVGDIPEEALQMLKIAGNNTERLLLLINDILDLQKIESGQMVFKFQNMALMPFLEQAVADNAGYGNEYGIKFVISKEINDTFVFADKDRLMQVMANLMSNAAKFSPEGEVVEISVARHSSDSVRISVTDHGSGIPVSFQSKLFDKFTQSDSTDTRQKGGTGLGLSISKIIIEKHGGLIDYVTHEGVGSTFYFELPEQIGELVDDETPRRLRGRHVPCVLIVEDDPDIAALLKRMLAEAGYNSEIAYDVNQARQKLQKNKGRYKAITLDLILPDEGGMSLLEELHSESSVYNIPVVVVSVKADEEKRGLKGGAARVVDWLQKPIDQSRLISAVKQAAGSTRLPRVLHVEDEEDVHAVVSVMLRDHCELTWTTTVVASKEALATEEFDLVLLDIRLPDGSGLDLLELIEERVTPPKVVIFSAYDVTQEYSDKVSAVLVKSKTDELKLAEVIDGVINSGIKTE